MERDRAETKLTERMAKNQKYPGVSHISFGKFLKFFTWKKSSNKWNPILKLRYGHYEEQNLQKTSLNSMNSPELDII